MAEGVQGRDQYSDGRVTLWCDLDGGHVKVEIRAGYERPAVLLTPPQAVELGNLLGELAAAACDVERVTD